MSHEITCQILHETDKAIRVTDSVTGETFWVPLSAVNEIHRDPRTKGADRIVMEDWIARKLGLL